MLETHLCDLHTSSHICQSLPIFAIMTQASRENYRLWAERFVLGAAAAQRLHTELQGPELASMREAFLRNEMDKELAAAVQPAMAGPYWHATKSAIQAGHSVDFCRPNTCFSTPSPFYRTPYGKRDGRTSCRSNLGPRTQQQKVPCASLCYWPAKCILAT